MRDGFGHVLKLLAREAVLLESIERQILQSSRTLGNFLTRKIRLELLENVLGHRAFLEVAGKMPRFTQGGDSQPCRGAWLAHSLLVGRQIQMQTQRHVARCASFRRLVQVIHRMLAAIAVLVGQFVLAHNPTPFSNTSTVSQVYYCMQFQACWAGVEKPFLKKGGRMIQGLSTDSRPTYIF